jgi:hypothetical protein
MGGNTQIVETEHRPAPEAGVGKGWMGQIPLRNVIFAAFFNGGRSHLSSHLLHF